MYKFYFSNRSLNDATEHYVSIIERSIMESGGICERTFSLKGIKNTDRIITIEAKDFFFAHLKKPKVKKLNWFQGITPEEAYLVFGSRLRKYWWEIFEKITLRSSVYNFFVSEAMANHYKLKYKYHKNNFFVMPCYNKDFKTDAFTKAGKYENPTFVYAGSMAAWQCIDRTCEIFKAIETRLPNASLTLLTADAPNAEIYLRKYNISNAIVKYCPLEKLQEELEKYKYGFLIRQDHIVNNVATPTKMNSYLSAGIIPVYTDVVDAFEQNLHIEKYAVKFKYENWEDAVNKIVFLENEHIDINGIMAEYKTAFEAFYNDSYYINLIKEKLISV